MGAGEFHADHSAIVEGLSEVVEALGYEALFDVRA